jgi:hypothetical protein
MAKGKRKAKGKQRQGQGQGLGLGHGQLNRNYNAKLHVDNHNHGSSWIIGLGPYEGGTLWIMDHEHGDTNIVPRPRPRHDLVSLCSWSMTHSVPPS